MTDELRKRQTLLEEAKKIIELEQHPAWPLFVARAQEIIKANTPVVRRLKGNEAEIASQMVYVTGIQDCLNVIELSKSFIADVAELEAEEA